ncbi:hypothetical protein [Bradyrhizobium sp. USDA 4452]
MPWGTAKQDELQPGPINDYVEVIDVDPASRQFYDPVDLNDPYLLAQDGLTPSEGNPQFHQQMVFAVAMKIIHIFERALGRKVIWAPHWNPARNTYEPVDKLRVYPHALREANAYYSMAKRALLFGTSAAPTRRPARPGSLPHCRTISSPMRPRMQCLTDCTGGTRRRRASTASRFTKRSPTSWR